MSKLLKARRRSSIATTIALCASFVGASFATAQPAAAITSSEAQMVRYINHHRSIRGIATLRVSGTLSDVARAHSRAMANAGKIYHTSNLGYRLRSFSWTIAGENVGRGPSLRDIHIAMMKSPAHRDNILYRKFKKVGVGVVWRSGRAYVTEMFIG